VLRVPVLDAGLWVGSHQNRVEEQNHLCQPAGHVTFMQPRIWLAFWAASAHLLLNRSGALAPPVLKENLENRITVYTRKG